MLALEPSGEFSGLKAHGNYRTTEHAIAQLVSAENGGLTSRALQVRAPTFTSSTTFAFSVSVESSATVERPPSSSPPAPSPTTNAPAEDAMVEPPPKNTSSSARNALSLGTPRSPPAAEAWPWRPNPPSSELGFPLWQRVLFPTLCFMLAFAFFQFHIEEPPMIVFDEAHYVKVARSYANGVLVDGSWGDADPRPLNFEHPPLGKYLIAASLYLSGRPHQDWENQAYITTLCGHDKPDCSPDARAWRTASSVAGASGVAGAYLVGLRIFNRRSAGLAASLLLLLDGMYYMHARLALLDIFPTAFTIWAFAHVLSPWRFGRPLGAFFYGCALASKYTALFVFPLFLLAQFLKARPPRAIEIRDASKLPALLRWCANVRRWMEPWAKRVGVSLLLGAAMPIAILLLFYAPYFWIWADAHGVGFAAREWLHIQREAIRWDYGSDATHPYQSSPHTWFLMIRPVFYYSFDYPGGVVGKMFSLGNPLLWWTSIAAIIQTTLFVSVRFFGDSAHRFLRPAFLKNLVYYPFPWVRDVGFFFAALWAFAVYVPWLLVKRRPFLFYMTFAVPAFAIFAGGLVGEAWDRRGIHRLAALLYLCVVLLGFVTYYPVVSGSPITIAYFHRIMNLVPWMCYPGDPTPWRYACT